MKTPLGHEGPIWPRRLRSITVGNSLTAHRFPSFEVLSVTKCYVCSVASFGTFARDRTCRYWLSIRTYQHFTRFLSTLASLSSLQEASHKWLYQKTPKCRRWRVCISRNMCKSSNSQAGAGTGRAPEIQRRDSSALCRKTHWRTFQRCVVIPRWALIHTNATH